MRTRRSNSSSNPAPSGHRSVLLHEAVESLGIRPDDIIMDATLGGAGHAREMLNALGPAGVLVGFDADEEAIERSRNALSDTSATVHFVNANFRHLKTELANLGIERITKALFDLGWSSYQLSAGRGFSFLSDEPLSMAYAQGQSLTAFTIVNEWGEESLADIIFGWGEERYSRRIARAIVAAREKKPIETGKDLGEIVKASVPTAYRYGRLHPATKTFQALRIAVNDELGALTEGLKAAWEMLAADGRMAVITFHSIEDRLVKRQFAQWAEEGTALRITKKPIIPTDEEVRANPRSRSAKLRVVQKVS